MYGLSRLKAVAEFSGIFNKGQIDEDLRKEKIYDRDYVTAPGWREEY